MVNLGLPIDSEATRLETAILNKVRLYGQFYNRLCNKEIAFLWRRIKEGRGKIFYNTGVNNQEVKMKQKIFFRFVNWILRGTSGSKKTEENK